MGGPAAVLTEAEAWFTEHEFGHLELPDGWFGRPWDGQHLLTFGAARPQRLILELDEHLLLIVSGPVTARREMSGPDSSGHRLSALVLADFSQLVFDQRWYGSAQWSARVFERGRVRMSRHVSPQDRSSAARTGR